MTAAALLAGVPHTLTAHTASSVTTRCITTLPSLERELAAGLLQSWKQVVDDDPLASCFQSPGWCIPWYRSYRDEFDPHVVVVSTPELAVGIVPLAVRREDGQIMFASGSMADYRDIAALPAYRRQVTRELIRVYLAGNFPNPLEVGWLDPASDTARLVEGICREQRVPFRVRSQPCYRWFPPPPQKPSAQKFLNWYRRQGEVTFDVIESDEDWATFRDEYYRQHSLRQIQAGRDRAFDDPRRTAFYEMLFQSPEIETHVTAFSVDGRMLAGHFGYIWRGVLLLGPPTIRLEDEQRSPAVILLAWIIQNAEKLRLRGFDLTIGDSDFKKRLANQCVQLTMVDVYGRRHTFVRQRVRSAVVDAAKAAVTRLAGPEAWGCRVKPLGARVRVLRERAVELGAAASIGTALGTVVNAIHVRRTGRVFSMRPHQLRRAPAPHPPLGGTCEIHDNQVDDLLLGNGSAADVSASITACVRTYSRLRAAGGSLHTLVVNGQLAAWCCSSRPTEAMPVPGMPGAVLEVEAGSAYIFGLHTIPVGGRRELIETLLCSVLERQFQGGAIRAYTTALSSDAPASSAIERVGFEVTRTDRYGRTLGRRSLTSSVPDDAASEFETYLAEEWRLFAGDAVRQLEARRVVADLNISSVLDIGCGGGQDLIPFASDQVGCVGIDVSHAAGVWGTKRFREEYPAVRVSFLTAAAEQLPFRDGAFDLALCRVAIPYTSNRIALSEIGRVLRPGGVLLLKTHSPQYYLRKFREGLRRRSPLFCVHALRVLLTGAIYHVTGRQPAGTFLLRETFQSRRLLGKELERAALFIEAELADWNALTPSYRIAKRVRSTNLRGMQMAPGSHLIAGATRLFDGARTQLQRLTWKTLRRRVSRLFSYAVEDRIYRMDPAEALDLPSSLDFARDSWDDLQMFVPTEGRQSRAASLDDWRARLARGEHVYTRVEAGRLVSYGWMLERQKTAQLGWTAQTLTLPDDCAVIYDFYTLPEYRHRDFYQRLLMHVTHEAAAVPGTRWVYVGVRADDTVPRWWVERLGFTYCESYYLRRVLGRETKWRSVSR